MSAGNAIASGSVIISANADSMANGLGQQSQKIESWGKGMTSRLGSLFKGGLAFGGGMAIADTVLSFPSKVLGKFHSMKEDIDHASKSARAFGTDMGTWQGIVHAADLAGVGVEQLESGLARFRKQVDGPIDEALFKLAHQLEGIQDPGERARVLVDNFGKSGLKMAGLFEGGEEGLRALVAEAEKLGFAMSDADGKAIEEANDAVRRTEKAVDGLWNKLVVALAPAFTLIANNLTNWITMGQPVFDWLSRAFTQYFELASMVWEQVNIAIQGVFEWVGNLATGIFDLAGGMPTVQQVIVGMFRAVGTAAAYVWDTIKAGAGAITFVASFIVDGFGMVVKLFKEIVALAKELPDEVRPGWIDGMVAGVEKFEADVHDAAGRMRDWGKGAMMNWGEGARQFNAWLDLALVKKKKLDEPKKMVGLQADFMAWEPTKLAGAIEKGTKEAYSIAVRNQFGNLVPQKDRQEDILKQNGKKQDKANDHLKNIEKRLKDLEEI